MHKMDFHSNDFPEIESVKAAKRTLWVKVMTAIVFAGIVLAVLNMEITIIQSQSVNPGLKILSVVLSLLLLSFLVYTVLKGASDSRKNKINRITVDQNGLHHYKDNVIMESLAFESLRPGLDLENYDVIVSEGEDTSYTVCVYYFDKANTITSLKAVTLNTPFSIRNAEELERHFITGILKFRPDLKVSPKVLALLDIKNS